jgi:hypothetical protein
MELILIFLIPFILWILSLVLLSSWDSFFKFAIWNAIIIILYVCLIIYGGSSIFGHDEYGLGKFSLLIFCIISHTLIVFIFAIYKNYKLRNHEKST